MNPARCTCTDLDQCPHIDEEITIPAIDEGSVGWEFRPPQLVGREGCDLEIEIDGATRYQQRPPTHVGGSAYRSATVRTIPREISEAEATRELQRQAEAALGGLTGKQAEVIQLAAHGLSRAQIAEATGLSLRTVKDRLARARRGKAREK